MTEAVDWVFAETIGAGGRFGHPHQLNIPSSGGGLDAGDGTYERDPLRAKYRRTDCFRYEGLVTGSVPRRTGAFVVASIIILT